jgi:hypothetical protein
VASGFFDWVEQTPELVDAIYKQGGRTLLEHLEQTFCDFRCSERPAAGDLRRMMPNKHGIWKLHPPGLRIYGWCPAPATFVAVAGALETATKTVSMLNDKKLQEVRAFISKYDLPIVRGDILAIFPIKT